MLNDEDIVRYQAYILYSKNLENIVRRIANYLENCQRMYIDVELREISEKICSDSKPIYVELKSYIDVDRLISESGEGYGIVFRVPSPKDDIHAIAFIPVNNFNKSVVRGARRV